MKVVLTGQFVITGFNRDLFEQLLTETAAEVERRRAFLEKFTGLPVVVLDPSE